MSNVARVIELFPAPSVETLAAEYLRATAALKAAQETIKRIEADGALLAGLQARGDGISVAGLGYVRAGETPRQMRLDQRAAAALLIEHKIEVPMSPSGGAPCLKVTPAK